jgi:hypothetical protein
MSPIGSNPGTFPGTALSKTPISKAPMLKIPILPQINTLDIETQRLQKLENMREFVKYKKVMEYESETIELYEMISEEFDYNELRKESEKFNIK